MRNVSTEKFKVAQYPIVNACEFEGAELAARKKRVDNPQRPRRFRENDREEVMNLRKERVFRAGIALFVLLAGERVFYCAEISLGEFGDGTFTGKKQ